MAAVRSILDGRCIIHVGDCLEVMRGMPSDSVDCVCSSPPYWGLRQYLPKDAVRLRKDLTSIQVAYVQAELAKAGLK